MLVKCLMCASVSVHQRHRDCYVTPELIEWKSGIIIRWNFITKLPQCRHTGSCHHLGEFCIDLQNLITSCNTWRMPPKDTLTGSLNSKYASQENASHILSQKNARQSSDENHSTPLRHATCLRDRNLAQDGLHHLPLGAVGEATGLVQIDPEQQKERSLIKHEDASWLRLTRAHNRVCVCRWSSLWGQSLCSGLAWKWEVKDIHVDDKLQFVEEPVEMEEREINTIDAKPGYHW
ncbi:hypothetical protein Tco_1354185 [Tanacetum coccineum]